MKVLAGSNPGYTGDVLYNGRVVEVRHPADAKKLGIQIVYQEVDMALVPTLTVAENVMFNDTVMNMKHKLFMNYGKIRKGRQGSAEPPERGHRCRVNLRQPDPGPEADGADRPGDSEHL